MEASVPPPDVAGALNRAIKGVRWREGDTLREFTNVALAKECADILGAPVSHSHIAKIRQGATPDPRGSILWALGLVLSAKVPFDITPDYFLGHTRTKVDRELDLHLEQILSEMPPGPGGHTPPPQ